MHDNEKRKRAGDEDDDKLSIKRQCRRVLDTFLTRHRRMQAGYNQRVSYPVFLESRLVRYYDDEERGLYRTWIRLGYEQYEWLRCQYALGTRVDYEHLHDETCLRGTEAPEDISPIQRALAHCGCPVRTFNRRSVWLVSPPHMECVDPEYGPIWNGKVLVEEHIV